MKRNNPSTSTEAYKSLHPDQIREVYKKIISALEVLRQASSEQIAIHLAMEHAKIHKRVSEMEGLQLIYRPGLRVVTKSGRTAYVWCLCTEDKVENKTTKTERSLKGKTVSDYSKKIKNIQKDVEKKNIPLVNTVVINPTLF